MVIDWQKSMNRQVDATWPPANALLSDLVIWKVVSAGISQIERNKRWPNVFQSAGHIITHRANMGPAANHAQRGLIKNVAYRQDCILHGDLGADALADGNKNPQRTGVKSETYTAEEGVSIVFTNLYQSTLRGILMRGSF